MKLLISLALVASFLARAEQTNQLTRTGSDLIMRMMLARSSSYSKPLALAGKDGNVPVLIMEPLASPSVRELFPAVTVYRLISSSDYVHGAQLSALLVNTNGLPIHLQTDDDVAFFLGHLSQRVNSKEDALRLVRAFADLRSYKILESAPDFPDVRPQDRRPAPVDTDYKFVAEERLGAWRVCATFFTSDYSGSCERYVFSIWKSPGAGMDFPAPVVIRLRNFVI